VATPRDASNESRALSCNINIRVYTQTWQRK
jgi:hypothetical protein